MVENLADLPAKPRARSGGAGADPAAPDAALRPPAGGALQPDQRAPQVDPRLRSGRRALLARAHAAGRRGPALHRPPAGPHGVRGHRPRRSLRLALALAASQAYEQLGSPEGELALAECAVHLACAPKSNAVYRAFGEALARGQGERLADAARAHPERADPADEATWATAAATPTTTTRPSGFSGQNYFPDGMERPTFYRPTDEGAEAAIRRRLEGWAKLRRARGEET